MKKMLLMLSVFFCMTLTIEAQGCGPNASYVTSSCVSGCASVYSNTGTSADFYPQQPSASQVTAIEADLERRCNMGNALGPTEPSLGDL